MLTLALAYADVCLAVAADVEAGEDKVHAPTRLALALTYADACAGVC
jgi:hypothetical protein